MDPHGSKQDREATSGVDDLYDELETIIKQLPPDRRELLTGNVPTEFDDYDDDET
jgi:hypothetical protein